MKKTAVVVGAGIAGLCAARVLADFFETVVVIDKDSKLGGSLPRSGAAQGAHLHVLLHTGQRILKNLFPDLQNIFKDCPKVDWAADTLWESRQGAFPNYQSGIETTSFSRPFLEKAVLGEVCKRKNIRFLQTQVEEFSSGPEGVKISGSKETVRADILVLAGGQTFPLQRLLPSCSIEAHTEIFPIAITYRSVVFASDSLKIKNARQYYYQLSPPKDPLGAVICPQENGMSVATLVEYGQQETQKMHLSDFFQLASRVPNGHFSEIVSGGRALSEVAVFHKAHMHLRRLHLVKDFPNNIFCLGDIFCSLNPVFGQGMSAALLQVELLQRSLSERSLNSKTFHRRSVPLVPFTLAKVGSTVEENFSKRYLDSYLKNCRNSERKHKKFLKVLHLQKSMLSLLDFVSLAETVFCGKMS